MLYAIIAMTTFWLMSAFTWNAETFGFPSADDGMIKTLRFFYLLIASAAECFSYNLPDILALRDI